MIDNQHLLTQLEQLLSWKKSKKFYAEKLGVTEVEVETLLRELKDREILTNDAETANYISTLEDIVVQYKEDLKDGLGEIIINSPDEIRTLDELIEKCKIDTSKWEITKYVQNYWGNSSHPYWQVKAWLSRKKEEQVFQDTFIDFLSSYQPSSGKVEPVEYEPSKAFGCLVINKQDAHFDKYDVDGNNDINDRFNNVLTKIQVIVTQASLGSNLEKIVYIVGSDEFNSEFTGTTTKGTPQENIDSYHSTFEQICNHEIAVISLLLEASFQVEVVYVAGNHDEYVGWHLVNWLNTYFRDEKRVTFDGSPKYRKYLSYGCSALMFNHGDVIKPAKLAAIFPMEYKNKWSEHDNFYIFTGDKHHEVSQDFNGIKFYQIPAFSNAKSKWDEKNGYTCTKAEVTAFLIERFEGLTNIFKQNL